jgi:gliding motility-associated-like protein
VHFSIYNRWGEKLFESDGKRCWNGKINDKVCQEGAYAWKLSFIDCDGYRKVKTGNFTLIR